MRIDIPELRQVVETMQNRDLRRNFAHALEYLFRKYVVEDVDFHWHGPLGFANFKSNQFIEKMVFFYSPDR